MNILRYILFAILLSAFSISGQSQELPRYLTLKTSQGLSDNTVLCGLSDRYGFMWFGTSDGLNRFDGYNNDVFRNQAEQWKMPKSSTVLSLLEQDDDILIGASGGITIFNRRNGKISQFDKKTKYGVIISSAVKRMVKGRNSKIWIATSGQGFFVYDTRTGNLTQNNRHEGFIEDMLVDRQGNVWQVSVNGHLDTYNASGRMIGSTIIPGFINMKMPLCLAMADNNIWVGSSQGLYRYDRKRRCLTRLNLKSAIAIGSINTILPYGKGQLLLGTDRGVMVCNTATGGCMILPQLSHLNGETVHSMLRDSNGTLWVMTDNEGVCYLPAVTSHFSLVSFANDDSHLLVRAFAETADGRLWLGTSHGLYGYNGQLNDMNISGNFQTLLAKGNTVFAGSRQSGLTVINGKGISSYTYSTSKPYSLASNNIQCLLLTHDGQIYIGTNWGLCKFDESTHNFYGIQDVRSMTSVVSLAEDKKGMIWGATTSNGLFRVNPKNNSVKSYVSHSGISTFLPSNNVTAVICSKRGTVWIATGEGLCRYDEKHDCFHRVNSINQPVSFLCEDNDGNLWMGVSIGMIQYDTTNGSLALYDDLPGDWNGNDVRRAAFCRSNGEILVGTSGGFYRFHPSLPIAHATRPNVYITQISFPWASNSDEEAAKLGVKGQLYVSQEVSLPYDDNTFTLHFSSPRYGRASRPQFEYKLDGYDRGWTVGADYDGVTYSHVPPGTYTFQLREAGGNKVAKLRVRVLPPWYLTVWAYAAYIMAAILGLWLFYRWNRQTLRKKYDERLREYKAEQEKLVFQSKIRFFIDLVHEIRTPLSLISLPLELLEKNPSIEEAKRYIGIIHKNMSYLLGITNHLLDFQKMEQGKMQLHMHNANVNDMVATLYDQFADYDKAKGIGLQTDVPEETIVTALDKDMIGKVLMNLMSNASKYAKSRIVVRLSCPDKATVRISVIDDGPGVPDQDKTKIFDAYYQVDEDHLARTLGTGLGLSFAKNIAEAHGGSLSVTDAPGGGSDFRLDLPLKTIADSKSLSRETARQDVEDSSEDNSNNNDTKRFTLMMVEDNEDLLALTTAQLKKWYRVVTAKNGADAMQQLKTHDIDLIVSDVMMPVMDGIELCRHIKQNINYSHIPVILLTAKTMVAAKEEGLEVGADVYIEKPFSIRQLHLQISNLLLMRQQFYERMQSLSKNNVAENRNGTHGMTSEDYKFMKTMNDYLERNLANEDFSIGDLADELNMSRSSFYRKIKALTDMTPVDYTRRYRLDTAARMLREGKRISDVMIDVGFTSSSYFAKCFKNQFGVLPKEYVG